MGTIPHYRGYDVMREAEAWDDHTREIVKKRLEPPPPLKLLRPDEAVILGAVAATLMDEDRPDITGYVVSEIDGRLAGAVGEGQRKVEAPPEADLVRRGLAALEAVARGDYGSGFPDLQIVQRQDILGRVERGEFPDAGLWQGLPQKELFQKLLDLSVEACYSHPALWSRIGHGGPAYPRGYVRTELNLTDPWEARREMD